LLGLDLRDVLTIQWTGYLKSFSDTEEFFDCFELDENGQNQMLSEYVYFPALGIQAHETVFGMLWTARYVKARKERR
jgi:hypothetical protein